MNKRQSIPSVALARMAIKLASARITRGRMLMPVSRYTLTGNTYGILWWPISAEYYRIIDRLSRGEAP